MTEEEAKRTIENQAKVTDLIWDHALADAGEEGVESDWIPRDAESDESE